MAKFIYILYKTVRTETNEYYVGVHGIDTDEYPRFNDPYLGSGNRITASVKKHGAKAFRRSILAIRESRKEIEALEAAIVTIEMIADPLCLNIAPGGQGGVAGVPKSAEHRQAISDGTKGVPKPWQKGENNVARRLDVREKIRLAITGEGNGMFGKHHSVESRQLMSNNSAMKNDETLRDSRRGDKNPCKRPEVRQKIKDIMNSPEIKERLRKGIAKIAKIVCEHCGIECLPGLFNRWHGLNCKHNPNRETEKTREEITIECEYCKESFSKTMFKFWHGDKCNLNPLNEKRQTTFSVNASNIKVSCIHCHKEICVSVLTRWHGDNCKQRNQDGN